MNQNLSRLAPGPEPIKLSGEGNEETRTRDSDCGKGVVIVSTRGAASPCWGQVWMGPWQQQISSPESLAGRLPS